MNKDSIQIVNAMHFAATKHAEQKRKGYLEEPYFNHVSEVAWILANNAEEPDTNLIIAGLLHDTIEDTDTTHDELVEEFGNDVANLVQEVTDDKNLEKQVRKQLQIDDSSKKSDRAKQLKIADKISNLCGILSSPPLDWSRKRKLEYAEWSNKVIAGCKGVSKNLDDLFFVIYSHNILEFSE